MDAYKSQSVGHGFHDARCGFGDCAVQVEEEEFFHWYTFLGNMSCPVDRCAEGEKALEGQRLAKRGKASAAFSGGGVRLPLGGAGAAGD